MTRPVPFRVVVVDDHPATRFGVAAFLDADPDLDVVAQAGDVASALRLVRLHRPDVVVVDIDLPDRSGAELASEIAGSSTRVVVYTAYSGRGFVRALSEAGASGYVTKDQPEAELVAAVKEVARGGSRWLVSPVSPVEPAGALTERERDILGLLARGRSNAVIADTILLSESTVRNSLTVIYQKIGAQNAREAIAWAHKNGVGGGSQA